MKKYEKMIFTKVILSKRLLRMLFSQLTSLSAASPDDAVERLKIPLLEASNGVCASSCAQAAHSNAFGAQPLDAFDSGLSFFGVLQTTYFG